METQYVGPRVEKVHAFTIDKSGGNPAGVVLDAERLSAIQRQALATQVGYSETAFVERRGADLRMEYFTPARQIEICGHATVGAFSLLRDRGKIDLGTQQFQSVLGTHRVEVRQNEVGLWQSNLFERTLRGGSSTSVVAQSLGIETPAIAAPTAIVSNGAPFLLIEVKDAATLAALNPDQQKINAISNRLKIVGYYVYFRESDHLVEARMFAPRYGIAEESATGMAAGALAISLNRKFGTSRLQIKQGHLMPVPSPSLLKTEMTEQGEVLVSGASMYSDINRMEG